MNHTKQEQPIVHELLKCSREIGRKEKYKDRIRLFILFSWIFTAPCLIIFLLFSSSETTGPMLFFGSITVIGILVHYLIKNEIIRLHKEYYTLEKELQNLRHKMEKKQRTRRKKRDAKVNKDPTPKNSSSLPKLNDKLASNSTNSNVYHQEEVFRHDQDLTIERSIKRREQTQARRRQEEEKTNWFDEKNNADQELDERNGMEYEHDDDRY